MGTNTLAGRHFFESSGRVNWASFVLWAALAGVASLVLALVLFLLYLVGWYLIVFVPAFATLGVAGMVWLAVKRGHCRSRVIGGLLGLLTGLTLYLGYYYIGMVYSVGIEHADRIDLLPKYIKFRLKHDVTRDVGAPERGPEENDAAGHYFNWGFFALEFGIAIVLPTAAGFRLANKPYCEKCGGWLNREVTRFQPQIGPAFVEALRLGAVQSLAALFTSPQKDSAPNTAVALDYCPSLKSGRSADCTVYLSIKQVTTSPPASKILDSYDGAQGKVLVRQVQINPEELAALLPRFSVLETVTGMTAEAALKELQVTIPETSQVVADIRPVDPQFAGKVLTTKNVLIGNAYFLALALSIVASFGILIWGGITAFPDHPPAEGVLSAAKVLGICLMVLGGICFLATFSLLLTVPDYFSTRYLRRLLDQEFARRPNHLVQPNDPDVHFAQVVPRANWGKMKLDDASDVGFLRIDKQRGELLFEGDKEYYRIPGAAITSCEIEKFIVGQGSHGATTFYRLVVTANHPSGFWEAPFAPRGGNGKFRAKKRAKWAANVQEQVKAIMPNA